jgi:hypothetical protein
MVLENTQKCLVSLAQLLDIALYIYAGETPINPLIQLKVKFLATDCLKQQTPI